VYFLKKNRAGKKSLTWFPGTTGPQKLDIRDWSPDHEKMGKGVTLSKEEAQKLLELLQGAIGSLG
jgi:hypothetical protein